jgi:hypothetical protein
LNFRFDKEARIFGWNAQPQPPADQMFEAGSMTFSKALINEGNAGHSERAIRYLSEAIRCPTFDVRCIHDSTGDCTFNELQMSVEVIAKVITKLRHRNANGSGIIIRPCLPFALADDLSSGTIDRLLDDGYLIAAVVETSPGSHQVWIPLGGELSDISQTVCAAACERLNDLYEADMGVVHRDSFGRAPGFFNRKPKHEVNGRYPLVTMVNRLSGFRGYDRTLLAEAEQIVSKRPKPLAKRSVGAVLNNNYQASNSDDYLGPIEVWEKGKKVSDFTAISTDHLFDQWLSDMLGSGYVLPIRSDGSDIDRSQRDLHVLRSMRTAGVSLGVAQAALEKGSDKAQERDDKYVQQRLETAWRTQ